MKILLTGATGLLGAHILQAGLAKGWSFRVLSREISPRSFLSTVQSQVEIVQQDLLSLSGSTDLLKDIDVVIHAAAFASPRPEDAEKMQAINYEASKKLFQLAQQASVSKWVQISTTAVLTGGSAKLVTEENFGQLRPTAYARSKYDLDVFLRAQKGPRLLTIYPGYMLGAWDSRPSSGAVFLLLRMNRVKHYLEGMKNFVAASDVAHGIIQALEADKTGDYILGGQNQKISEFLKLAQQELGVGDQVLKAIDEKELQMLPPEEKAFVQEFCSSSAVSIEKAQGDFAYAPKKSLSEMIQESVDYMTQVRLVKRKTPKP